MLVRSPGFVADYTVAKIWSAQCKVIESHSLHLEDTALYFSNNSHAIERLGIYQWPARDTLAGAVVPFLFIIKKPMV